MVEDEDCQYMEAKRKAEAALAEAQAKLAAAEAEVARLKARLVWYLPAKVIDPTRPSDCPSGCHYLPDKEDCPKDCFYLPKPARPDAVKRRRSK